MADINPFALLQLGNPRPDDVGRKALSDLRNTGLQQIGAGQRNDATIAGQLANTLAGLNISPDAPPMERNAALNALRRTEINSKNATAFNANMSGVNQAAQGGFSAPWNQDSTFDSITKGPVIPIIPTGTSAAAAGSTSTQVQADQIPFTIDKNGNKVPVHGAVGKGTATTTEQQKRAPNLAANNSNIQAYEKTKAAPDAEKLPQAKGGKLISIVPTGKPNEFTLKYNNGITLTVTLNRQL